MRKLFPACLSYLGATSKTNGLQCIGFAQSSYDEIIDREGLE